eukprot:3035906-Pyramimonas_sp.AAC.1
MRMSRKRRRRKSIRRTRWRRGPAETHPLRQWSASAEVRFGKPSSVHFGRGPRRQRSASAVVRFGRGPLRPARPSARLGAARPEE